MTTLRAFRLGAFAGWVGGTGGTYLGLFLKHALRHHS